MGKKCFEPIFDDQDRIMPKLTYLEELRNAMDHIELCLLREKTVQQYLDEVSALITK